MHLGDKHKHTSRLNARNFTGLPAEALAKAGASSARIIQPLVEGYSYEEADENDLNPKTPVETKLTSTTTQTHHLQQQPPPDAFSKIVKTKLTSTTKPAPEQSIPGQQDRKSVV